MDTDLTQLGINKQSFPFGMKGRLLGQIPNVVNFAHRQIQVEPDRMQLHFLEGKKHTNRGRCKICTLKSRFPQ